MVNFPTPFLPTAGEYEGWSQGRETTKLPLAHRWEVKKTPKGLYTKPKTGFAPATFPLQGDCSAVELQRQ